jgi:hypothetical protein
MYGNRWQNLAGLGSERESSSRNAYINFLMRPRQPSFLKQLALQAVGGAAGALGGLATGGIGSIAGAIGGAGRATAPGVGAGGYYSYGV